MSNKVSRRGFLGILGATGVAAAIPWKKAKPEPTDMSEYIDNYDIGLEQSADGEHWKDYLDNLQEETIEIEGTWDTGPSGAVHGGKNCSIILDGVEFYVQELDTTMPAPQMLGVNPGTYIQGLHSPEIRFTTYATSDKHENFSELLTQQTAADFELRWSDIAYKGKAYITDMTVTYTFDDLWHADVLLRPTGELTICPV